MTFSGPKIIEANQKYYKNISSSYDEEARGQSLFNHYLYAQFCSILGGMDKDVIRVLDFGIGTGFASEVLLRAARDLSKSVEIDGIDVSADMVEHAKKKLGTDVAIQLYNGIDLPTFNNNFDFVIFCSVLHHLYDPGPVINQICPIISPGGAVYIAQEPNPFINTIILSLRRLFKLMPDEATQEAEYHQFFTPGIAPKVLCGYLNSHGITTEVSFTNSSLIDELTTRFGRGVSVLFVPLRFLNNRFMCLSYSIRGAKQNPTVS